MISQVTLVYTKDIEDRRNIKADRCELRSAVTQWRIVAVKNATLRRVLKSFARKIHTGRTKRREEDFAIELLLLDANSRDDSARFGFNGPARGLYAERGSWLLRESSRVARVFFTRYARRREYHYCQHLAEMRMRYFSRRFIGFCLLFPLFNLLHICRFFYTRNKNKNLSWLSFASYMPIKLSCT